LHILKTDVALTVLRFKYSLQSIEILQGLGYPVTFPHDDKEKYNKDIDTVIKRSKGVKLQLEITVEKVKELQKNNQKPQTENEFMDGVASVGRFLGSQINIKTTSLYEMFV